VNAAEKVVLRKKLRRKEMVVFFEALAPTVIGIEACGASHHWARILRSFGHEVKLIAPQLVKPYVKRGKNDTADAEALCEAMSRPTMRFVPVKTAEQQAALMMAGLRDRLIRNRTQLSNAIRGYAAEFGFTSARGMAHIDPLLDRIQADESVPVLARELFAAQAEEYAQLQAQIVEADAKLMAWHKADECSRRKAAVRPSRCPGRFDLGAMDTSAVGGQVSECSPGTPELPGSETRITIAWPALIRRQARLPANQPLQKTPRLAASCVVNKVLQRESRIMYLLDQ
jgi:transposase